MKIRVRVALGVQSSFVGREEEIAGAGGAGGEGGVAAERVVGRFGELWFERVRLGGGGGGGGEEYRDNERSSR